MGHDPSSRRSRIWSGLYSNFNYHWKWFHNGIWFPTLKKIDFCLNLFTFVTDVPFEESLESWSRHMTDSLSLNQNLFWIKTSSIAIAPLTKVLYFQILGTACVTTYYCSLIGMSELHSSKLEIKKDQVHEAQFNSFFI